MPLLLRKQRLTDPALGELVFYRRRGYWEGKIKFPNPEGILSFAIQAPASGPREEDRAFIMQFAARSDFVLERLAPLIESEWALPWNIVCLDLVRDDNGSRRTEITLENEAVDLATVEMDGPWTTPVFTLVDLEKTAPKEAEKRSVGSDMRWGIKHGLGYAAAFSVLAVFGSMILGPDPYIDSVGMTVWAIAGAYAIAGIAGGTIAGLLRPFAVSRKGVLVFSTCVCTIVSAVMVFSLGSRGGEALLVTLLIGVIMGLIFGIQHSKANGL